MGWDVVILNKPASMTKLEQYKTLPLLELGTKETVLGILKGLFPDLDLSDPTWGKLRKTGFTIDFNIGDSDPLEGIMLHIRGDDQAIEVVRSICTVTGWSAYDTSTDEFIDFEHDPATGLRQWRTYRNQVIDNLDTKGE